MTTLPVLKPSADSTSTGAAGLRGAGWLTGHETGKMRGTERGEKGQGHGRSEEAEVASVLHPSRASNSDGRERSGVSKTDQRKLPAFEQKSPLRPGQEGAERAERGDRWTPAPRHWAARGHGCCACGEGAAFRPTGWRVPLAGVRLHGAPGRGLSSGRWPSGCSRGRAAARRPALRPCGEALAAAALLGPAPPASSAPPALSPPALSVKPGPGPRTGRTHGAAPPPGTRGSHTLSPSWKRGQRPAVPRWDV